MHEVLIEELNRQIYTSNWADMFSDARDDTHLISSLLESLYILNKTPEAAEQELHTSWLTASHQLQELHTSWLTASHQLQELHTSWLTASHQLQELHTSWLTASHQLQEFHTSWLTASHQLVDR
ncbi:hypothetical protein DPMN_167833 [Dreissena polymorpha]|uniref:Uncharacterized protein n=1 Tax=Dreissena polymorpha TaxID=45954 RepID=A0A9D4IZ37_DREPO|nr:hypothetical protein DPMN_167833 [Dreissena polymorpha]